MQCEQNRAVTRCACVAVVVDLQNFIQVTKRHSSELSRSQKKKDFILNAFVSSVQSCSFKVTQVSRTERKQVTKLLSHNLLPSRFTKA